MSAALSEIKKVETKEKMLIEIIFSNTPWSAYESGSYETVLCDLQKLKYSSIYIIFEVYKKAMNKRNRSSSIKK